MNTQIEIIDRLIFKECGMELTNVEADSESQEYGGHSFQLDRRNVKFRVAKITPTKTGQFVTLWKRNEKGITEPFDVSDNIDLFIVAAQSNVNFGLFIFPKSALDEHRILSNKTKDGKRGFRVYPPWDLTTSNQAQRTQLWQTRYFLELSDSVKCDLEKMRDLLIY